MPMDEQLKASLLEQLKGRLTPEEDPQAIADAQDSASVERMANVASQVGSDYIKNMGGGVSTPIEGTSAQEDLARQLKARDASLAMQDKVAMGLLKDSSKPEDLGTSTFNNVQIKQGQGEYSGAMVNRDKKGNYIIHKGKKIYEKDAKDPSLQKAFRNISRPDAEDRRTIQKTSLANDEKRFNALSNKEKDEIQAGKHIMEDIAKMRILKDSVDTGQGRSWLESGKQFFEQGNQDYATLQQKSEKLLADFTKLISGAQVAEAEKVRLLKVVPNTAMGDERFVSALDTFEDTVQREVRDIIEIRQAEGRDASGLINYFSAAGLYTPSEAAIESGITNIPATSTGELKPVTRKGLGLPNKGAIDLTGKSPKTIQYGGRKMSEEDAIAAVNKYEGMQNPKAQEAANAIKKLLEAK